MNCPRCETSILAERDRDGVSIDVCRTCRGVWLDRGELEKLIARATEDAGEDDDDDDDDDGRRARADGQPGGRKRGWFQRLGDIFD